jgi:outer membrane protein assembly factor BamD (BamD/ComL family)
MLIEHAVELARRGFKQVLDWKPAPDIAEKAELGLGQCYEALGQWGEAKKTYDKFITDHSGSNQIEEARFRAADIVLNREQNAPDAMTLFQGIWIRSKGPMKISAGLRVGDCHARMNEYGPAISAWTEVLKMSNGNQTEDGTQALMRIARANIWQDSIVAAQGALDSILAGNTLFTSFNDAVLYTALLEDGGYHGAVKNFAEADFSMFCNNFANAADKFAASADFLKYGRLAEWSRMQQAESLRELGKPNEAITALDSFITEFPESVDLPRAKYLQIVIRMEDLHDDAQALVDFQKYLMDYPRSLYLEQARRKARILQNRLS